jgi:hypothetical protein
MDPAPDSVAAPLLAAWDEGSLRDGAGALDAERSVAGIDEFLETALAGDPAHLGGAVQSIHLHATDVPGEWLVTVGDGNVAIAREHAKGDVAVRATASDLFLLLWGRLGPDAVEFFGDRADLDRFLARVPTAT